MQPREYQVYDNFLSEFQFKKLQESIFNPNFPWFKNDYKLNEETKMSKEEDFYNIQLIHSFYKDFKPNSPHTNLLMDLLEKINPIKIFKVKANLTFCTPELFVYGNHTDHSDPSLTTAVFYLNSNNGATVFEDGQSVESIENRLLVFDSQIPHSGTSCTNSKFRSVINLNYVEAF